MIEEDNKTWLLSGERNSSLRASLLLRNSLRFDSVESVKNAEIESFFFNIAGTHTDHITQPLCFIKHLSKHWTWIYILKASGCFIFMKDKLIKLKSIGIWDSMGGLAFFAFLKSFCTQRQKQTSGCQAILFWREKKAGNVATTMHKKNVDLHKTSVALSRKLSCIYNPFSLWALLR